MPTLQLHQLRVAGVAKVIVNQFKDPIDKDSVLLACLFHDMGNIIKSDLSIFPEFLQPEGLEYWQGVKNEFLEKYGPDEHAATITIAKEAGLPVAALHCIERIGFSHATENDQDNVMEYKVCNYVDMRVGPYGVLSMNDRIIEGQKRYAGKKHSIAGAKFDSLVQSLENIEKVIFGKTDLKPEDVNNEKVNNLIEELRKTEI